MKIKKLTNLSFNFEYRVSCLSWSPDNNYLAVATDEGEIAIVSTETFETRLNDQKEGSRSDSINCRWHSTHIYYAHPHPVTLVRFTSNSRALISSSYYHSTKLWSVRNGGQLDRDSWEVEGVSSLETWNSQFACLVEEAEVYVEIVDLISHESIAKISLGKPLEPPLGTVSDNFVYFLNEEYLVACLNNKAETSELVIRPTFTSAKENAEVLTLDYKVNSVYYDKINHLFYTSSLQDHSPVIRAYYVKEDFYDSHITTDCYLLSLPTIENHLSLKEKPLYQTTKLVGTSNGIMLLGFDYRGFLEITELKRNGEVSGESDRVKTNLKKTDISAWKNQVDISSDGHYLSYCDKKEVTICYLAKE